MYNSVFCSSALLSEDVWVDTVSFYIFVAFIYIITKNNLYFGLPVKNASLVLKNKPTFKQIHFFNSHFKMDIFSLYC